MKVVKLAFILVAAILVIAFISLQIVLSFQIHMDSTPVGSLSSIYEDYEEESVQEVYNETMVPEEQVATEHITSIPTLLPAKNDSHFNPAGIPFSNPKWYSLFRHYQKVKEKEANENVQSIKKDILKQFDPTLPYQHIQTPYFDFVYIKQGCVDVYKRSILMIERNVTISTKTHLRTNLFSSPRSTIHFPGFESYTLFTVNGTIPESIPTMHSNLTWILGTPQEISGNECFQSFYQYIPLFYQSVYSILPTHPEHVILPFFPVSRRKQCSKLAFEISHFSLLYTPQLQYGKQYRTQLTSNGYSCYTNMIITTAIHHQQPSFPFSIHYDCFRAAAYKYFNIKLRYGFPAADLVLTHLYSTQSAKPPMLSLLKLNDTIRSRDYALDEYSMREAVVLYCNSDIVVQWDAGYDFFVYFLLPYNAFICVGDEPTLPWAFHEMRVLYYTVNNEMSEIITTIQKAKQLVIEKKYKGF